MPTYTSLQDRDIREITRPYGVAVDGFDPFPGGNANTSYLVRAGRDRYVLTIFEEKSLSAVSGIGNLLLLLARHGIPSVRLLSASSAGAATVFRDKPVLLKSYVSGQVCEDLDDARLRQIGAALARLHEVPPPAYLPIEHAYGLQTFSDFAGRGIDVAYEDWLVKRQADLEQRLPRDLPRGLIHGDLFFDNVLFDGPALTALIDFEEACHYDKGFDLGMAALGLCATDATLCADKVRSLVCGYEQVRRLREAERDALQLFIEYAAIATSRWRFWKYHIDTCQPDRSAAHVRMARLADHVRSLPAGAFREAVFGDAAFGDPVVDRIGGSA